jgi:hypothetical protein
MYDRQTGFYDNKAAAQHRCRLIMLNLSGGD